MFSDGDNRFSGMFDNDHDGQARQPVGARSEAQREASRRNGGRSRGPVTEAGKAKSSLNSLKHGFLAKRFVPASDFRGDDVLYRRTRRALLADFKPKRFSDGFLVDQMARDYVQLTRVVAMLEALQSPTGQSLKNGEALARDKAFRREIRFMTEVAAKLCGKTPLAFAKDEAGNLADTISTTTARLWENWQSLGEESDATAKPATIAGAAVGQPAASVDAVDDEDRELQEIVATIGTAWDRLTDKAYVKGVLAGSQKPKPDDRVRLAAILKHAVYWRKGSLIDPGPLQKSIGSAQSSLALELATAPDALMLLSRYQRQIQSSINRNQRRLERR